MRLLLISDLHGQHEVLGKILERAGPVDAALLAGDITDFGSPGDAEKMVRIATQAASSVFAVAGNCDSPEIDRRLAELGVGLHGRGLVFRSMRVQGLSAMPPWKHKMYQFTEEELAGALAAGWSDIEHAAGHHVVLSHAPPRGMKALDRTHFFLHAGSTALRQFLEQTRPLLVVCGHIHEGRGVEQVGNTTVVNCGHGLRGYYAVAELDRSVRVELARL